MVLALLMGRALWSSSWSPVPVRAVAAVTCIGIGAAASWGRWRGRAADAWIVDVVVFMARTHRVAWNWTLIRALARKPGAVLDAAEHERRDEAGSLAA